MGAFGAADIAIFTLRRREVRVFSGRALFEAGLVMKEVALGARVAGKRVVGAGSAGEVAFLA